MSVQYPVMVAVAVVVGVALVVAYRWLQRQRGERARGRRAPRHPLPASAGTCHRCCSSPRSSS